MPEANEDLVFKELVYGPVSVQGLIRSRRPDAVFSDASDIVHTERFEVKIPGVTEDEFYPFAIKEGFARACFVLELMLQMGSEAEKIKKWIRVSRSYEVKDE
jgi:hypothetical protein